MGSRIIQALLKNSRAFPSPLTLSVRKLHSLSLITSFIHLHNSYSVSSTPKPTPHLFPSSLLTARRPLNTSSAEDKRENGDQSLQYEDETGEEEWEEEEETEAKVGDGGDGGGVALQGVSWGERVLSIAHEVLSEYGDDMKLYAFKTSPRGYIYVRLDKLPNQYGCPSMEELESYSREYNKRLDEVGAVGEIPDDLALEVSSPGAERILKVPTDLCRFKDMPMKVCYAEDSDSDSDSDSVSTKHGYFMLESMDADSEICEWRLADVRENRDPQSKGRPLSRKRKDWRLKLHFSTHRNITLYLGNA